MRNSGFPIDNFSNRSFLESLDMGQLPHVGRLLRGQQILKDLIGAVQEWSQKSPAALQAQIAPDRLSYTVTLDVNAQPPLDDWAYRFGEVVHHLRASLDNLLVHVATESGITDPKRLKRIQFPVCVTAAEWRDSASRVADLPATVRDAVQQVQPFNRGPTAGDVKGDLLVMLRDLSNRDKHHARVITSLTPLSLTQMGSVEFETEEGASASVPPDITITVPSFETGGILYAHRTKGRIAKVGGRLDYHLQVHLDMPDGQSVEIAWILNALGQYTDMVLTHVASAIPAT
jgi:hypothetical protein